MLMHFLREYNLSRICTKFSTNTLGILAKSEYTPPWENEPTPTVGK